MLLNKPSLCPDWGAAYQEAWESLNGPKQMVSCDFIVVDLTCYGSLIRPDRDKAPAAADNLVCFEVRVDMGLQYGNQCCVE